MLYLEDKNMFYPISIALDNIKTRLTVFTIFLAIATSAPLIFHNQFLTGPIVNAILFIITYLLGPYYGIAASIIPSGMAVGIGLLPVVLLPMIGFIILGNIILVSVFNSFKRKNLYIGFISAAIAKFVFIYAMSAVILRLYLKTNLSASMASMMGINQLYTALLGGLIAYAFLKSFKKLN